MSESTSPPANPEVTTIDFKPRRRRGPMSKIAQLPAHQRMLLNQLLDQDKTYDQVVDEMAKHGVQLNTDNISKWCTGPYQDYLAALDWQDELHQLRDHAYSFTADGDVRFQEGVVQIGLTQVFRDIKEGRFKDDPANSLRLLNSLARLSREALVIRKFADQSARQQAVELKQLDQDRDLSDNETLLLVNRMDRVFRRRRPSQAASSPATPSSNQGTLAASRPGADGSPIPGKPDASVASQSQIKNQNSKIPREGPAAPPAEPTSVPPSEIENQKSEIENCYDCAAPLPPLLPNGQRPLPACRACGARLYPPGTRFDQCSYCQALQPILADNERPSTDCRRCRNVLPPVGQRFVTHCPACCSKLPNLTPDGIRPFARCHECNVPLPLLEPAADPPATDSPATADAA